MKISGYYNNIQGIDKSVIKQTRPKSDKKTTLDASLVKKDEVVISSHAFEIRKFEEIAKNSPEIREDKIGSLKEKIQSSSYVVDGKAIAKSILDLLG